MKGARVLGVGRVALTALCVSLVLASCALFGEDGPEPTPLTAETPAATAPTGVPPAGLRRFYSQQLDWRECRGDAECAELQVPLDYARPQGKQITLSLLRVPALDEQSKVGALVVNPGGPGASGVDHAAQAETYFGRPVRRHFDVVGFDPRGVGESTPVDCLSDAELDTFIGSDPDPETPAEVQEAQALLRQFGEGCLERSGDLARHVSTEEVARDIDVLRAVLGQDKLAFFGASYGTLIGATYADLFPERVGRMVLDGAVDPSLGLVETSLVQAESFETALGAYVADCVDEGGCYLGETEEEGLQTIRDFLDRLDSEPLELAGARDLTQGWAVLGIWAPLYNRDFWSALDVALSKALDGNGQVLMSFAEQYVGRGPTGYLDNSTEALYAVNCLDDSAGIEPSEARALEDEFLEASPTFGRVFAFTLTSCASWPVQGQEDDDVLNAEGAAPILVVGTSRDPATPLRWAEGLAEQLESGVLVRRDGDGHTGYLAGNDCVDDVVEEYLVSGVVPDGPVDC